MVNQSIQNYWAYWLWQLLLHPSHVVVQQVIAGVEPWEKVVVLHIISKLVQ